MTLYHRAVHYLDQHPRRPHLCLLKQQVQQAQLAQRAQQAQQAQQARLTQQAQQAVQARLTQQAQQDTGVHCLQLLPLAQQPPPHPNQKCP